MAKQDNLGEFEQLALLAVIRLGKDAYGTRIQRELEETAGRQASVSAIYITLTRLEEKGMVSSWLGGASQKRGGRARRFFKVEPAGREALEGARDRLLAMWAGVGPAAEGAGSL